MSNSIEKERLDQLMVDQNIVPTRSRAKAEIMAGNVFVNGKKVEKPGTFFFPGVNIELHRKGSFYVSRGGDKLEKAIKDFNIDFKGKVVLDIGASTGGFTHCALQNGAEKVYALDVGYGQLAWELRNNPRIKNMERINIRFLDKEELEEVPDLATVDVSFISLRLIFPVVHNLGIKQVVALIKPQFEASPQQVGKKGVVRDKIIHREILTNIIDSALSFNYEIEGISFSPLKGPQGNIEYLIYLLQDDNIGEERENIHKLITEIIDKAYEQLVEPGNK